MSAATPVHRVAIEYGTEHSGRAWGPSEGWTSLALLGVMLLSIAWAVDDAGWAGTTTDGRSQTAFLAQLVLLAGLWGFASAKTRLPALLAHLAGAVVGAAVLIVAVAGIFSSDPSLAVRVDALETSLGTFLADVLIRHIRSSETSAFLLTVGAVAWASGQYAGFAIFRRHRPLAAVGVLGSLLVLELLVTAKDQYAYLIIFSAAALLLLVRLNLVEQRAGWRRRGIGDASAVSGLYTRTGIGFVVVTLAGAMILTANASSAPLASLWRGNVQNQLVAWGQTLDQWVGGVVGPARGPSGLFSTSQTIRGVWQSSTDVVFTDRASDGQAYYWRAATYDTFDGITWKQTDRTDSAAVPAGSPVLASSTDSVKAGPGRVAVDFQVTNVDLGGDLVLAPDSPLSLDRGVDVYTNGPDGPLQALQFQDPPGAGESYQLKTLVRAAGQAPGALTQAELAAAGTTYPGWLTPYVQVPAIIGQSARSTAARIVESLPLQQRDPYHIAAAVQDYLYRTGGFRYQTDVQGLCPSSDVVDCFLLTKRGYCEYFATTMTMLLRIEDIPTRYVMGFLPGQRLSDGSYQVDQGAAHAWVEVYFPGYGWVPFDPTPGNTQNGQRPTLLAPGKPVPTPSTQPSAQPTATFDNSERDPRNRPGVPVNGGGATPAPGSDSGSGPLAAVIFALLALVAVVVVWRARPRRGGPAPEPDVVYRSVARLAGRFGYGPRPTQTAYEYAASLAEVVPTVRPELQVVARAKVEATYANRPVGGEALETLREAYRRLRVRLLALAFRRRR